MLPTEQKQSRFALVPRIRKRWIALGLGIALILSIALITITHSEPGIMCEAGTECYPLPAVDFAVVPQSVVEDANQLASELFGGDEEECNIFVSQVLSMYLELKDEDFALVFNSGGMGWKEADETPAWVGISDGIESELTKLGYSSIQINHLRTDESWLGVIDELMEMMVGYPLKAKDLAYRIDFLTEHLPNLKVIVTAESNGTIVADRVMSLLRDNPQAYSIQTGPPFWRKQVMFDRTLVVTDNGIIPDTFSRGDIIAMFWGTIKVLCGFSEPVDDGNVLYYVRAPGHDYQWHYPGVHTQITNFLEQNFGLKNP